MQATSLRERNRLATWQLIHDTAAELVLQDGLAVATVESITERAGCSRRTFFNYFSTKEDAILGMREPRLHISEVRAVAAEEPDAAPFERTMRILIYILSDIFPVPGQHERRRLLLVAAPSLKARFVSNVTSAERLVLEHLQTRAEHDEPPEAFGGNVDEQEARVLLMLAGSIIRYAATYDAEAMLSDREDALRRATATFREVIEHTV